MAFKKVYTVQEFEAIMKGNSTRKIKKAFVSRGIDPTDATDDMKTYVSLFVKQFTKQVLLFSIQQEVINYCFHC